MYTYIYIHIYIHIHIYIYIYVPRSASPWSRACAIAIERNEANQPIWAGVIRAVFFIIHHISHHYLILLPISYKWSTTLLAILFAISTSTHSLQHNSHSLNSPSWNTTAKKKRSQIPRHHRTAWKGVMKVGRVQLQPRRCKPWQPARDIGIESQDFFSGQCYHWAPEFASSTSVGFSEDSLSQNLMVDVNHSNGNWWGVTPPCKIQTNSYHVFPFYSVFFPNEKIHIMVSPFCFLIASTFQLKVHGLPAQIHTELLATGQLASFLWIPWWDATGSPEETRRPFFPPLHGLKGPHSCLHYGWMLMPVVQKVNLVIQMVFSQKSCIPQNDSCLICDDMDFGATLFLHKPFPGCKDSGIGHSGRNSSPWPPARQTSSIIFGRQMFGLTSSLPLECLNLFGPPYGFTGFCQKSMGVPKTKILTVRGNSINLLFLGAGPSSSNIWISK